MCRSVRAGIVIPAYNAARTVGEVVRGALRQTDVVLVVDDGSTDGTGDRAREAGATVVRLDPNAGKGSAIVAGLAEGKARGCEAVVVVDADGQHDPADFARLVGASANPRALVLGVRDLRALGAPALNRFANAAAAWPVSFFIGRGLGDVLCGLRRYPIDATLRLAPSRGRYEWESAVILALARTGTPIVQTPIAARYGPERFSFYRPWVDTLRTIASVVARGLFGRGASRFWGRAALATAGVFVALFVWAVVLVRQSTPVPPPGPSNEAIAAPAVDRAARSEIGRIRFVRLSGDPYAMGFRHARLLEDLLRAGDREMIAQIRAHLPNPVLREILLGAARLRFRHLDEDIPAPRRLEILGETRGYRDPYAWFLPTYARFVYYHGLYDIALSFEGSPLVGCTAFAAGGAWTRDGHTIVGRNFDLEQDAFDRDKVVFLVAEDGKIPYLSVAWAGLTGVLTGMNAAGLWVSVNGARGGSNLTRGVPLPFVLREILQTASTIDEAERVARANRVMVPHLLLVASGTGEMAVFERTPQRLVVRRVAAVLPLANHYLDPGLAADPRNHAVLARTSSRDRFERLVRLLDARQGSLDVASAAEVLRDHAAADGRPLGPSDRRAIDASIATHSVIADLTDRILWVAESPHTRGRYVPFDLPALLGERPEREVPYVASAGEPTTASALP